MSADTIRRQRREGPDSINIDEVKLLEQRFTRIGKEKAQSGKAYKEMTEHVITTGASPNSPSFFFKLVGTIIHYCAGTACSLSGWNTCECVWSALITTCSLIDRAIQIF